MTPAQDELLGMAHYHGKAADEQLIDYSHGDPTCATDDPTSTEALLRVIAAATTSIALSLLAQQEPT